MNLRVAKRLDELVLDREGATAVEYAVMLALIVAVVILAVQALGLNVGQAFQTFLNAFASARS